MVKYDVELTLLTDMLGTVPKNKDVYTKYIESKKPREESDEVDTVDENSGWDGFHISPQGKIMVYNYFIKGFLKYAGNVVKDFPDVKLKAVKNKVQNLVFVYPRQIEICDVVDGALERPLRGQTPQGIRVSLKKSDFIKAGTKISFQLTVLNENIITEKLLNTILAYGEHQGLGQWRNGGYGTFGYALVKVK